MGAAVSADVLEAVRTASLVAQSPCVIVDPSRACAAQLTKLWVEDWKHIRDVYTSDVVFHVDKRSFTFHHHQELMNTDGQALLVMRRCVFKPKYSVHDGDNHDPVLCTIDVIRLGDSTSVRALVKQSVSGDEIVLDVSGDWYHKTVLISRLPVKPGTTRQAIAKVLKAPRRLRGYYVTVAAGVDVALIVLLCRAMDEEANVVEASNRTVLVN